MFENNVLKTILKYQIISNGDKIVVAVSGGPDSMALLNTLYNLREQLKCKLYVAHVNHMIRAVADDETEYVKEFCKNKDISFYMKKVNVLKLAQEQKISTEEAGRNERYNFFEEIYNMVDANKIAIAHNANDNAETVLMNIIRGTGISGLKGIEPIRFNKYIRPLIETQRKDIENYCKDNFLNPKYDESNKENIYTRNKVRNILIPLIKEEFNPNIIQAINRLSDLASDENRYIDNLVEENYKKICIKSNDDILLDLKKFNELDSFIKSKVILLCIYKLFGTTKGIEKKHIEDIIKLCGRNIGNKYLSPNKNIKIYVGYGQIRVCKIS